MKNSIFAASINHIIEIQSEFLTNFTKHKLDRVETFARKLKGISIGICDFELLLKRIILINNFSTQWRRWST